MINHLMVFCSPSLVFFPRIAVFAAAILVAASSSLLAEKSITQHGITWTFDKDVKAGTFANGDHWVVGPVTVVGITTDLHADGFTPQPGEDGSMVNPGTDNRQGYNLRLNSYDENLNAGLAGGDIISPKNPLALPPESSLVSTVSWLYRSEGDAEPGAPRFNKGTNTPRPVVRSGAVLTVLPEPPPEGSFRPPYSGTDKTIKFNVKDLDLTKLQNLPPVGNDPDPEKLASQIRRPWIDHVYEYLGAFVHPSENMPSYGRDMAAVINHAALVLNMDFSQLPGGYDKQDLLVPFVQMGIDFAGIADAGGGWPANGGHHMGRKLPILFAGTVLNDPHLLDVGNWGTRFQENEQTFIVSQADVEISNSAQWNPDKRGGTPEAYTPEDIGLAEWGIRHAKEPVMDNREWKAPYRAINNASIPGFALAAKILGKEESWNHPALFAYADRVMKKGDFSSGANAPSPFVIALWNQYENSTNPTTTPTP